MAAQAGPPGAHRQAPGCRPRMQDARPKRLNAARRAASAPFARGPVRFFSARSMVDLMYEEILKNVYRIEVPLPGNPLKVLNSYLFIGKERNLLVDTGFRMEECRKALTSGLTALGADMNDTDILLTHMHSDHSGLAPDIASPNTRIYISETDLSWLIRENKWAAEDQELVMYRKAGMPEDMLRNARSIHPGYKLAPDQNFRDYKTLPKSGKIPAGDYELTIIPTPGHTPGHVCLWLESEKTLFSGDHVLFDITPNIQKWVSMENSLGSYLASLRMIRQLPAEKVFPAHRETGDLKARIDELLAHHTFRLNECKKVVTEAPGLTAFDITGRMTWRIRAKNWEDFPPSQKWFAVGECLSHLDFLSAVAEVRFEEDENGIRHWYAC